MKVQYEWDREWVDEHGDVQDHNHSKKVLPLIAEEGDLVLVRDVVDEFGSVEDRQWAYVKDGKLPEEFCGGARVPKRFHSELAHAITTNGGIA